jgi:hypothetical protein
LKHHLHRVVVRVEGALEKRDARDARRERREGAGRLHGSGADWRQVDVGPRGEGTVRLLLGILAGGGDAETPESVTLPHKLVVRGSTAPPAKNVQRRK